MPDLPEGARLRRSLGTGADVVPAFVRRAADLEDTVASVTAVLGPEDAVWVLWPRRAAGGAATSPTTSWARPSFRAGWWT